MSPKNQGAITALEFLEGAMDWGLRLAGLAVLLVTGYYLYVLFAGQQIFSGLSGPGQMLSAQEFQRHLGNMQLLSKVLIFAAAVLVVCALGRYHNMPETGVIMVAVGAGLFFGIPLLIESQVGQAQLPAALAKFGSPRAILESGFRLAGAAIAGAGVAQLIVHAFLFVVSGRARRPKVNDEAAKTAAQVRKANDQFLGPCWKLPFCRDTEKKLCPIRLNKKPCWRTGRGCYCDQNVILTLSGGNQYNASRGAAGYLSRSATVAKPKTLSEKRAQCLACPVYLHHQSQKYKLLAPGAVLAVVGAFIFYWGAIQALFPTGMQMFGRAVSGFSLNGEQAGQVPAWAMDLASNDILGWMIILVGGMLLIAYLLHAVEWVLYRLGI